MPRYFFTHTHLSSAEREMMKVPGFFDRKPNDIIFVQKRYSCAYCPYKKDICDCASGKCPYLLERLLGGSANRLQALSQASSGKVVFPTHLFITRLHQIAFRRLSRKLPHTLSDNREMAVLYLLSSTESLWERCKGSSVTQAVRLVETRGLEMNAYIILCVAKDILLGTSYTSSADYEDEEIMSNEMVALVYCASLILRFGVDSTSLLHKFI